MKSYYGKLSETKFLGQVTGEIFQEIYMKMSQSEDKLPVASTIIPITDSEGCTMRNRENEPLVLAWIFYEYNPQALKSFDKETGKVVIDVTEKEGRAMDKDVKEEVEVII